MLRTLESLLVCAFLCVTAPAQATDDCREAVEHFVLPSGPALTDYDIAPLEFLFSDHGQYIYSATSYRRPEPLQWIRDNGVTVIVVYQDETVRQQQIQSLRKSGSLPSRIGFPQHLEHIKYSMINFFGPSASFVRDIEYFEPKSCVTSSEEKLAGQIWMDYSDFRVWDMTGLHASKKEPNWVTGFYSPYLIVNAKDNPEYVKIHNAMADKVRQYTDRNGVQDSR